MLTVIACPGCGVPAEIAERFRLPSTDGPVAHIVVHCAAGHHFRMPADRLPQQPVTAPSLPRGTRQLCICCRENPAGFWVSLQDAAVVRRPWCLACCARLDRAQCEVVPFGA
jgi:hypothetical protein